MDNSVETLSASEDSRQSLEDVGASLREARLAKGLEIHEIAKFLRIRASVLEAIENGNREKLIGDAYFSGFLRSYAKYLGVDGEELVAGLAERGLLKLNQFNNESQLHIIESRPTQSSATGLVATLSVLAVAGLVLYAVVSSYLQDTSVIVPVATETEAEESVLEGTDLETNPDAEAKTITDVGDAPDGDFTTYADIERVTDPLTGDLPEEDTAVIADSSSTVSEAQAKFLELDFPPAPPLPDVASFPGQIFGASEEFDVEIIAVTPSWVELRDANDRVEFSQVIQPGDRFRVPRSLEMTLVTGNAGGLVFEVYGFPVPPIGREGQVRRLVLLTPEGLRARFPS